MGRILIACTCLLFLAGCMMGPDYIRPTVDVPAAYRFAATETADTADSQWWKQFGDPVLDKFIAEALANNRSVKIAAANVERAAGALMSTRSALFPQFSYTGTGARQHASKNTVSPAPLQNPFNSYQAAAAASWEIDLWGRIRRLTEAAQASLLATEEARRGVILSLVSGVASSYIQLRGLDEQLEITKRTLKAYAESVRLFELQFKHGVISRMTVEQARSQYETAAATIPQLEMQIAEVENALSLLLGRSPGPIERGKTITELAMVPVPAGLPSQLLERRPDVLQAEQNLIAANAQIGAARALYFPAISLTGVAGYASEDLSNLFLGPSNTWSYGGSIVGPIFTAGNITGLVRQSEAAQKAALFAYEDAIKNAFADMENALVSRQKLVDQLGAEERRVGAYQEYARLAWLQYNGGYTPYLTVLSAQQQQFPAELSAAQTRAAAFVSLVNIYKAMGGGWVVEADRMTAPQK